MVAGRVVQFELVDDLDTRQWRQHARLDLVRVGLQLQHQQVARQVQRVGDDVVGELRGFIKWRQADIAARGREEAAVEDDVTPNRADALVAQLGEQGPQLRHAKFGVGTATQYEVAFEHVAVLCGDREQLSAAAMVGPQAVQHHRAGDELERRRRLHQHVGAVRYQGLAAGQGQHHGAEMFAGQAGTLQRVSHCLGQGLRMRWGRADEEHQQRNRHGHEDVWHGDILPRACLGPASC